VKAVNVKQLIESAFFSYLCVRQYSGEDWSVLGCFAFSTAELLLAFWRDVFPSSSLSDSPRRARISRRLGLPEPEDRGATFNREVGNCSPVDMT
jgi:hypothetical protein